MQFSYWKVKLLGFQSPYYKTEIKEMVSAEEETASN